MPEGHTVHRLARQFSSVFAGERLRVSSPQGRFTAGAEQLDGAVLVRAAAHGKQLFLHFDNERVLRVHLGLYGAWNFGGDAIFRGASSIGAPRRVGEQETPDDDGESPYAGPPDPVGAVRVRLASERGWADLRGPTACEVITEGERAAVVGKLGPDPLDPEADGAVLAARLRGKSAPVGRLLMDQAVIAGVGNVYRAEVLFLLRINPWRPGAALDGEEVRLLWSRIRSAMQDGVREGRIITTAAADRVNASSPVASADAHYVYKRTGEPCRICGTAVAMAGLAGRKLYWCPDCQAADQGD